MSKTPRTDAECYDVHDDGVKSMVPADFARTLERELNEARAIIRACHPAIDPALVFPTNPSLPYRIGYFLAKTEHP